MATLCLSGSVVLKAGSGVSSSLTDTDYNEWIEQAEGVINSESRINWVDKFSGLNTDVQGILQDAASSHAAMAAISYDMSGYTSRSEAQTMLDVNFTRFKEAISLLKEKHTSDFIDKA